MRRAILSFVLTLLATLTIAPAVALAQGSASMNALGLIDYYRKPEFKIGDWIKYRVKSSSELGSSDDYEVTVFIAGEEKWWGENCFWIETITQPIGGAPIAIASLISYDVFKDSLAITNSTQYVRKQISTLNEDGSPKIELVRRPSSTYRARKSMQRKLEWYIDTLDVASREVPAGTFTCQKILYKQAAGGTVDIGDSSRYDEVRENRTIWRSTKIPLTSIVLEEIENIVARKTWIRGRSEDAPLNTRDRAYGTAELVEWGTGRKSETVPEIYHRPIAEQRAAAAKRSG